MTRDESGTKITRVPESGANKIAGHVREPGARPEGNSAEMMSEWSGIMVFAEFHHAASPTDSGGGEFDPVTFELIGKAREMADKSDQEVVCVVLGSGVTGAAADLLHYPVDRVLVYDRHELRHYVAGVYAAFFQDAVLTEKPSIILMGATPVGRSLAPRIAVRFRTGLTADCTVLDIRPNGDLVQTRPAFGGNIMATILTKNARPQMATVRYKVMPWAERLDGCPGKKPGVLVEREMSQPDAVKSLARHLKSVAVRSEVLVPKADSISEAKVIVAVGRGVKSNSDLEMFEALAERLGGMLGGSRPLVEKGWIPVSRQIGQSGRTVRPDVYIALGISGAIQHVAGISGGTIIAVNSDKVAPIFEFANYGVVGDIYSVVPALLKVL